MANKPSPTKGIFGGKKMNLLLKHDRANQSFSSFAHLNKKENKHFSPVIYQKKKTHLLVSLLLYSRYSILRRESIILILSLLNISNIGFNYKVVNFRWSLDHLSWEESNSCGAPPVKIGIACLSTPTLKWIAKILHGFGISPFASKLTSSAKYKKWLLKYNKS